MILSFSLLIKYATQCGIVKKNNKCYLKFDDKDYSYEVLLCSDFLFKRKDEAIVSIYNKTKN